MGTISLQQPQIGQPDTTEDVKIQNNFTTLQNVINGGLDPTNLSPTTGILHLAYRNGSANLTANAGDWIVAVPGVTVTLPAPTLNAVVAVTTNSAVSGSSPVTISGTNIYGPGLSAASSFLLGSSVASVVLQSDASNWIIRVGQQDTGWVALTLPPSWATTSGYYTPAARLIGDTVRLRGSAQNNTGSTAISPNFTLPSSAFYPTSAVNFICVSNGAAAVAGIAAGGSGINISGSVGNGSSVIFDGLSFSRA